MTEQTKCPDPGVYHDVPFHEYLSWPCVSNSSLAYAAKSLAHYRYAPPIEATQAMRFGSLVHCGKLEPAAIGARYAVMPDFASEIRKPDGSEYSNVRATKAYKEAVAQWRDSIGDREVCTADELADMVAMSESLVMHDRARYFLCGDGPVELAIVWDDPDSGVRCKARIDKVNHSSRVLCDLKTTADGSEFERSIVRYGYYRQSAIYSDGWQAVSGDAWPFAIVAVEKEKPYAVRAAVMGEEAVEVGRLEYKRLLRQLAEARQTNVWPGYTDPDEWRLPGWFVERYSDELGVTINGELI